MKIEGYSKCTLCGENKPKNEFKYCKKCERKIARARRKSQEINNKIPLPNVNPDKEGLPAYK